MTAPTPAYRPSDLAVQREVGRVAIRVEGLLSRLRTDAVLRPKWYRPAWQAGREAGLREAHEAVQAFLDERGLPHFGNQIGAQVPIGDAPEASS